METLFVVLKGAWADTGNGRQRRVCTRELQSEETITIENQTFRRTGETVQVGGRIVRIGRSYRGEYLPDGSRVKLFADAQEAASWAKENND